MAQLKILEATGSPTPEIGRNESGWVVFEQVNLAFLVLSQQNPQICNNHIYRILCKAQPIQERTASAGSGR